MKRILIIGKNGQIGRHLSQNLHTVGEVVTYGREELDLSNPDAIRRRIAEAMPQVIINAAAYTAVDQAESEPEIAMAINGVAPGIIAEEAKRINAMLIHYSSDYVFDGKKTTAYIETDLPKPLSVYGKTKLAGEKAIADSACRHLILRTSWVYSDQGRNFLLTILRLAQEKDELKIIADQIGTPNWSHMIGNVTRDIIAQWVSVSGEVDDSKWNGVYHLTAKGQTSWFGFAKNILTEASLFDPANRSVPRKPILVPIATSELPLPATRPVYSVMSHEKLVAAFGISLPDWASSLHDCFQHSQSTQKDWSRKIIRAQGIIMT